MHGWFLNCLHKDTVCVFCSRLCEWYIHQWQLLQACQLLGHRCQHITLQVPARKGVVNLEYIYIYLYTNIGLWGWQNCNIAHKSFGFATSVILLKGGGGGERQMRGVGYEFVLCWWEEERDVVPQIYLYIAYLDSPEEYSVLYVFKFYFFAFGCGMWKYFYLFYPRVTWEENQSHSELGGD